MSKTAVIFGGQGAQFPGMGKDLYEQSMAARAVFDMGESQRAGIKELCFSGSKEELAKTVNTQPTLFLVGLAAYAKFLEDGGRADYIAGFSLGEIPALAASGMLGYEEAFRLVMARAKYMDECSTGGTMAAVLGLQADKIESVLAAYKDVICANYNAPLQTVISGKDNFDEAVDALKEAGARVMRLAVSGAFHSHYMTPAADNMAKYLANVKLGAPIIPIYSNVTGKLYNEPYAQSVSSAINNPVRWTDIVRDMSANGVTDFVECGAGNVLTGLVGKILG